jgi:uncharacterized protein (TIRG00374 family)
MNSVDPQESSQDTENVPAAPQGRVAVAAKSRLWQGITRWLPGVIISGVVLVIVFQVANWQDLGRAFSAVQLPNLSLAVALIMVSLGTRAMAWRVLLQSKAKFTECFFIINEGYLLNNIFPLRMGELGRAVLMGRVSGLGAFHVLSTIVIERAFDLAAAATLLLLTLPLALQMEWAKPVAIITLLVVAAGLVTMFLMARNRERVTMWFQKLGGRWPLFQRHVASRIRALLEGLGVLTSPKQFLLSLWWIAISWAIWVTVYYVMLLSIAPGAPFWWAAFGDGVLAMGVAVPSAPAALGVFEGSLAGALSLLGVPFSLALGYAILMHFIQFMINGVLGLWGLARDGRSVSSVFRDLQRPISIEDAPGEVVPASKA